MSLEGNQRDTSKSWHEEVKSGEENLIKVAERCDSSVPHLIVLHLSVLHFQLHIDRGGHVWGHGYYRSAGRQERDIITLWPW